MTPWSGLPGWAMAVAVVVAVVLGTCILASELFRRGLAMLGMLGGFTLGVLLHLWTGYPDFVGPLGILGIVAGTVWDFTHPVPPTKEGAAREP